MDRFEIISRGRAENTRRPCERRDHQPVPGSQDLVVAVRPWSSTAHLEQDPTGAIQDPQDLRALFGLAAGQSRDILEVARDVQEVLVDKFTLRIVRRVPVSLDAKPEPHHVRLVREQRGDLRVAPDVEGALRCVRVRISGMFGWHAVGILR